MAIADGGNAPYAGTGTIIELIEQYRERGLSTPVNLDSLVRVGVSETIAPRTLQAWRLLELIDPEGRPTAAFEDLRKAGDDACQPRLAELLRGVYAEVF